MRLGKSFSELARSNKQFALLEWVSGALLLLTSCFTVSIVPFTRKDFGERYFSWINLFFGYTIIANFTFLGNLFGVVSHHRFSWAIVVFWAAFVAMSLYRQREISQKNKAGIEWHSMSIGTSLLPLPVEEETIYKFIEPPLVFVAGLLFWPLSLQVGLWLMVGGVSLLINNHIVYYNQRQAFLDMRDAQIEARYRSQALAGRPARETGGFVIAASNIKLVNQDPGLKAAFAGLSSDMRQIFDAQPGFTGTAA